MLLTVLTAPQLFAAALGAPCPAGDHRCFFCGAACDQSFRAADHRSDTFTGWSTVAFPASPFVCGGCVLATDERDSSRRPRQASWVFTREAARRVDKGDAATLRDVCLSPPEPPFAVALAVSGQKHLIFLAPVNLSRDVVAVQLELERVTYRPAELAARLDLCGRVVAAAGKPAAQEPPSASLSVRLAAYWADPRPAMEWFYVWGEPASRLAAFLSMKMEDARARYPSDVADVRRRRVPARAGGAGRPGLLR
jgi:CRISPR type IV-associated protein Csf1